MLQIISELIDGKKTYIAGIIAAVINLVIVMGWVELTQDQIIAIDGLVLSVLGITIRHGIQKLNK